MDSLTVLIYYRTLFSVETLSTRETVEAPNLRVAESGIRSFLKDKPRDRLHKHQSLH